MPDAPRPELIVLDVDGTLTPHRSVWQYLHERLGLWTGNAERFWQQYRLGEIDYQEFCDRDAALWKGLPLQRAQALVDEMPYNPGVPEGLRRFRARGLPVALLSTGLTLLTDRIRDEFVLNWSMANHLPSHNGALLGRTEIRVHDGAKGAMLEQLSADSGVAVERMAAIGDGSNDVDVARRVGWFVAYRCHSDDLARLATHVCRGDDFAEAVDRILGWCGDRTP